ncbi:hypothetical protein KGY14_11515 [Ameyamaea chiangmaiensis]|uniref:Uncharacterized protein n=1 Tax=Ameyamaea chiangmaiensis TaxID=442969 RepID=A0A850PE35_9PROT|nr:hypothetical protein [Ameyamaea chiangmaiensis]MBS4075818.1 hypothetical protein [Ameyamaea chiangmaiensis]NVN39311.1 hypothetical protein [Ameyamaea chiangmaiensis]
MGTLKGSMVNLLDLSARCQRGRARLAAVLGASAVHYRPVSSSAPTDTPYGSCTLVVSNHADFMFKKPSTWSDPFRYGVGDSDDIQLGDIFTIGSAMWFVAGVDDLSPMLLVECNHVVSYFPSGSTTAVGEGWPCAMVLRARGDRSQSGTPGALTPGQFVLYSPAIPGVDVSPYMIVQSDDETSYIVDSVERTSSGWRLYVSSQQV